jgi:ribonucleoside-diphosphate reductase alpha chain
MMASMTVDGKKVHGTTSGIEPLFAPSYTRRKKGNPGDNDFTSDFVDDNGDHWMHFKVNHPGIDTWTEQNPKKKTENHPYVCAEDINWVNRVKLQAAAQRHVDHAISSTINLPNDVTEEEVAKIYIAAWKNNLKGITVYRDGCRSGVLITDDKPEGTTIPQTDAPKRPRSLPCEVFHTNVQGKSYFVLIGLWEDGSPYEIFSGRNGVIPAKAKTGEIVKLARPKCYRLEIDGEVVLQPITLSCSDDEELLTRMISTGLRHGVPVNFLLDQLTKVQGDMSSFAKGLARTLKKYIQDHTKSSNPCPECGEKLIYLEGCCSCQGCGYTGCS